MQDVCHSPFLGRTFPRSLIPKAIIGDRGKSIGSDKYVHASYTDRNDIEDGESADR